jgi:hypothetical protein
MHHLISQLIRGYSILFKNDDAVIIFLGVNTLEPLGIRQVMTSTSDAYILLLQRENLSLSYDYPKKRVQETLGIRPSPVKESTKSDRTDTNQQEPGLFIRVFIIRQAMKTLRIPQTRMLFLLKKEEIVPKYPIKITTFGTC